MATDTAKIISSMTTAATGRRGHAHLRGATTLLVPMQLAAEAFMEQAGDVIVTVAASGTSRGLRSVIHGTADIAMVSSTIDLDTAKMAQRAGVSLITHVVGYDALVPCLHPSNPIGNLDLDQLHDIFSGGITNWSEVGGPEGPITVVSHDPLSGHGEAWRVLVLGGDTITPKAVVLDRAGVRGRIQKDKGAIGFLAHTEASGVKVPTVGGVAATAETVTSSAYPLRRSLALVTAEQPSEAISRFIAYMVDAKGQEFVTGSGNVSLKAEPDRKATP